MPQGQEQNTQTTEVKDEPKVKNYSIQTIETSSAPKVYVFDTGNNAYKKALAVKQKKYKLMSNEEWDKKRNEIEEKYQKLQANAEEEIRKKGEKEKEKLNKGVQNEILLVTQNKDQRIRQLDGEALQRFPRPKLTIVNLEEGAEAPYNMDHARNVCFTKVQKNNLQAIRQNTRKFLFWTLKQSPEFVELQNSIAQHDEAFSSMASMGDDPETIINNATKMIDSLNRIMENAEKYIDKYKDTNYSKACNARKEMARNAAEMAKSKIEELMLEVQHLAIKDVENAKKREEFVKTETQNAQKDFDSKMSRIRERETKKLEKINDDISSSIQKKLNSLKDDRTVQYENLKKKQREPIKKMSESYRVVMEGSFNSQGIQSFDDLEAPDQIQLSQVKMAKLMFEDKNNPFSSFDSDPFGEKAPVDKAGKAPRVKRKFAPVNDVLATLKSQAPDMKISYSPNAVLTLSNLKLFDNMMGVKRNQGEYKVSMSFVKDGKIVPVHDINPAEFARMGKEGFSCVIENVRANPVLQNGDNLVSLKLKKTNIVSDAKINDGDIVPLATAIKLSDMDKSTLNTALPDRIKGSEYSPKEFFGEKLADLQHSISKRSEVDRVMMNEGLTRFQPLTEEKIRRQLGDGNFILNADSVYFDANLLSNMKDGLEQKQKKTVTVEEKTSRTVIKPVERTVVHTKGNLNTDNLEVNAVRINASASEYKNLKTEFNGDAEYSASVTTDIELFEDDSDRQALKDVSSQPLFEKTPSVNDIKAGPISNKPLLAALSSVIEEDPSQIYDMMKENDDNTVTCKFFNEKKEPVYVTVNKTIANLDDPNPIWVQLMEKAYMLSGISRGYALAGNKSEALAYHNSRDDYVSQAIDNIERIQEDTDHLDLSDNRSELFGRSRFAAEMVSAQNILESLTGKPVRSKKINKTSHSKVFEVLKLKVKGNVINKESFKLDKISSIKKGETADFMLPMSDLLYEASKRLGLKTTDSVNVDGKLTPRMNQIYMEDVLESIMEVAESCPGKLKNQDPVSVLQSARVLCDKITDFQMNSCAPGIHLPSRKPANYSAHSNSIFELVGKRCSRGDIVQCEMRTGDDIYSRNFDTKTLNVFGCTKGKGGIKNILVGVSRDEAVEIELNEFVTKTEKMNFKVSDNLYDEKELTEKVASSMIKATRKNFPDEFKNDIGRVLSEKEMIERVVKQPFTKELADKIIKDQTFREKLEDGEDLTEEDMKLSLQNQRTIKDDFVKATSKKDVTAEETLRRKSKEYQEFMKENLLEKGGGTEKELNRMGIYLDNDKVNYTEDYGKRTGNAAQVYKELFTNRLDKDFKEAGDQMNEILIKMANKVEKEIASGNTENAEWLEKNKEAIKQVRENVAKKKGTNPEESAINDEAKKPENEDANLEKKSRSQGGLGI